MENNHKTGKTYTVLEINTIIQGVIRDTFPDYVWVCGEIQDLRLTQQKKHLFFTLCQKHPEAEEVISKIKAVIFEGNRNYVFDKLRKAKNDFSLRDDIEVKVLCKVDSYAKWGEYQLIIVDIDPAYTLGQLAQSRERIIEALRKQGLLEKNKQLSIPAVPLSIGLITSYNSAAYHDFISELRHSGFAFKVQSYDAHMQGKNVEPDVIRALTYFQKKEHEVEVIVLTRGGGSTADLGWFDNQKIAEHIAGSSIPVFSAIGHEINLTIADYVAHTSFKTPTKAAQHLVHLADEYLQQLRSMEEFVLTKSQQSVREAGRALHTLMLRLHMQVQGYFAEVHHQLRHCQSVAQQQAVNQLKAQDLQVRHTCATVLQHVQMGWKDRYLTLKTLEEKVKLLDPYHTLRRGYSITSYNGKPLKDSAEVGKGARIETILFKGKISSTIERKEDARHE